MLLRLACLLGIAAQILLVLFFLRPTGRSAIAFTFIGNPLLALAVLLGLLWWFRNHRETNDATMARGSGADLRPGAGGG
jgi:hypothetical protein